MDTCRSRFRRAFSIKSSIFQTKSSRIYATGRQEEEDGKTAVCDKRDKAITCGFCRDLHLTPRFSGPLQKDLFKGK